MGRGGCYGRAVAQAARNGRAGSGFPPSPSDGRSGRRCGTRSPRGARTTGGGAGGAAAGWHSGDASGNGDAHGSAARAAEQAAPVPVGRGRGGGERERG